MTKTTNNPYHALDRVLHEPNRTAIMSALCGASDGLSFTDLRKACELTDGNLSRHLKTLEEASMIRICKTFIGVKPRTTVYLTDTGRSRFIDYLGTLEEVLKKATEVIRLEDNEVPKGFRAPKPLRV